VVVAHTFNPSTQKQMDLYEFQASLVYSLSSRTAKATQRNPGLKTKTLLVLPARKKAK
ncbi:hypothetical protein STEG23_033710, partial [Scotinomys teguina]